MAKMKKSTGGGSGKSQKKPAPKAPVKPAEQKKQAPEKVEKKPAPAPKKVEEKPQPNPVKELFTIIGEDDDEIMEAVSILNMGCVLRCTKKKTGDISMVWIPSVTLSQLQRTKV